jgi:hypothetical protein
LTEQTQIVSQGVKDQTVSHKPGIASIVNDWMANEIRGKLMDSLESKDFISFSTFVHDMSLNDLFFSNISAEWDIFKTQFVKLKPPSQAEITFSATKKLLNTIVTKIFLQMVDLLMYTYQIISTSLSL